MTEERKNRSKKEHSSLRRVLEELWVGLEGDGRERR